MTEEQARKIVKDAFENPFDKGRFAKLLVNLLELKGKSPVYKGNIIPEPFRPLVKTCQRFGKYEDPKGKVIDILIVHLRKESSLERARSAQRNFIGRYLKVSGRGASKDGVIAAFVSPDKKDWRFSFVKIDYSFNEQGKIEDSLSPARRSSFLVGQNESGHTAQQRFVPLLREGNRNPTLESLEDAFSVEKVTREFFEKYRALFHNIKEALEKITARDKKIKADFESNGVRLSDFSKKLLGQIVFLYFLQKKGWLGVKRGEAYGTGSKHFLRWLFDQRDQICAKDFYPDKRGREAFSDKGTGSFSPDKGTESSPPAKGGQEGSFAKGQTSFPSDKGTESFPPDKGGRVGSRTPYHFKRFCIEHSLYGVDIDPGAIEIAKLRLWLSLVVDEEDRETVSPLPNLDYKMLCGNSLLGLKKDDGFGTKDAFYEQDLKELNKKKNLYFNETSTSKKQKLKSQIQFIEKTLCVHNVKGKGKAARGKKIFDFEIFFSEVFQEKQGFDIVIANPPYVKEGLNKSAFEGLRESPYYQGKMDLWYFFACKGIDISRPDSGIIAFIAQNNWVTSFGASKMRNKLIKDSKILSLIDFGDFKVFEAGIQTMIMLFQKNSFMEKYNFDYRRLKGKNLKFQAMLSILNKEKNQNTEYLSPKIHRKNLLNKKLTFNKAEIENILRKLAKRADFQLTDQEVAQGVVCPQDFVNKKSQKILGDRYKTGDGVFVLDDIEKKRLPLTKKELGLIKPYYSTKQLFRHSGNPKNREWIIYTDSRFKNKSLMRAYPNIKKHLDQFGKIITSDNKPYGLHRARRESFFKGEKIIVVRKCAQPAFSYIDFDSYVSAAFYVIKTSRLNLKFLTAVLNSRLIAFWLRHKGKMQGSNYQIDKEPLLSIPLIQPSESKQHVVDIMNKILSVIRPSPSDYLQNPNKQAKVREYEKQIDQLVYQLYSLTPKEIKTVDNFHFIP